jgi:acyl-CoA thioester hydrolase
MLSLKSKNLPRTTHPKNKERMMEKENLKKLLELPIRPFWAQMDALGHINNSVYFTYCEQARIEWFGKIGLGDALSGKAKFGPVVVNASCTFLKPVVYPCDIKVILYAEKPGRSSFMAHYEITDGETLYTTGSSKIVWVDFEKGKSVEIPERIRELVTE